MSHESKVALERIVAVCERSENLSMNQCRIFDIALEGLGMVMRQRDEIVQKWKQPHIEKQRERRAARDQKLAEQGVLFYRGYSIERGAVFVNDDCVFMTYCPEHASQKQIAEATAASKAWVDLQPVKLPAPAAA